MIVAHASDPDIYVTARIRADGIVLPEYNTTSAGNETFTWVGVSSGAVISVDIAVECTNCTGYDSRIRECSVDLLVDGVHHLHRKLVSRAHSLNNDNDDYAEIRSAAQATDIRFVTAVARSSGRRVWATMRTKRISSAETAMMLAVDEDYDSPVEGADALGCIEFRVHMATLPRSRTSTGTNTSMESSNSKAKIPQHYEVFSGASPIGANAFQVAAPAWVPPTHRMAFTGVRSGVSNGDIGNSIPPGKRLSVVGLREGKTMWASMKFYYRSHRRLEQLGIPRHFEMEDVVHLLEPHDGRLPIHRPTLPQRIRWAMVRDEPIGRDEDTTNGTSSR